MRALSIRQPWASLIVAGIKDIENRTWRTKYRGPLLIHAACTEAKLSAREMTRYLTLLDLDELPRGGIIGRVEVVDCVETHCSHWFEGPIGWVLQNPEPIPFRRVRGALGLFQV